MDLWILGTIGVVVAGGAAVAGVIYAHRALTPDPRLSATLEKDSIVMVVRNHGLRPVYLHGVLVTLRDGTIRWLAGAYGPQKLRGRQQAIFTTTPAGFVEILPDFEPTRVCVRTSDGDEWWPLPPPVLAAIAQANAERVPVAD